MSTESLKKHIEEIEEEIDEIVDELNAEGVELGDEDAQRLVDLEQMVHNKLAVIFDKYEVVIGDERID